MSAAVAVLLAVAATGCVSGNQGQLVSAIEAWRAGHRDHSVDMARTEYVRFRIANEYSEAEVRAAADGALEQLEVPMLPAGEEPQGVPGPGGPAEHEVGYRLRADLLSFHATAVVRGAMAVRALDLRRFAPALLTVVFAQRVVEPDGGVLESQGPALRTLATKRIALDALLNLHRPASAPSGTAP